MAMCLFNKMQFQTGGKTKNCCHLEKIKTDSTLFISFLGTSIITLFALTVAE